MKMDQIITSLLDNDLYTFTVGQVAFHLFPRAKVSYQFINRNKVPFPPEFSEELREQINVLKSIRLAYNEFKWLNTIPYLRPTYIEWLASYKFDPSEVIVQQNGGTLTINIEGYWYRTIFWEVVLMAIISELYFKMNGQYPSNDWEDRIERKGLKLQTNGCHWIDFGTRRRFSFDVQAAVVGHMKMMHGFLGTSNPLLAMRHNVIPHGTYSHQGPMAMAALYGARMANKMWMKHWSDHFEGNVGVALTDTFTTDKFLNDFGTYEARLFDGVRQDSHDPYAWGEKMLAHYRKLNILTSNKRFVFSDNLNDDKYIALDKHFRQWAQPVGGIGTFFTNDVGEHIKPLNMVIKMTSADFGHGPVDVVKLSDEIGKHTGDKFAIDLAKLELNIK
jgi:nicotinate phosphoribosyltransferase